MFMHFLIAASGLTTVVPRDVAADAPELGVMTRGLVSNAAPRLAYDMLALAAYEPGSRPENPTRLGYAGYDAPGADWSELKVAHATAADIAFDAVEERLGEGDR